jgi:hypothetical protein
MEAVRRSSVRKEDTEEGHLGETVEDAADHVRDDRQADEAANPDAGGDQFDGDERCVCCKHPVSPFGLERPLGSQPPGMPALTLRLSWRPQGAQGVESASGTRPAGVLGHQVDDRTLVESRGGALGQIEMQLADSGRVSCRDLDERTASEYEVTAPRVGDDDRMEAGGNHVLLEYLEGAAAVT